MYVSGPPPAPQFGGWWDDWLRPRPRPAPRARGRARRLPIYGGANVDPELRALLEGYTDTQLGELGFSLKKTFKKVAKAFKPVQRLAGKALGAQAGLLTLGLVNPKKLGIKSKSFGTGFKIGKKVGRVGAAAAGAYFLGPAALAAGGKGLALAGKALPAAGGLLGRIFGGGAAPTGTIEVPPGVDLATGERLPTTGPMPLPPSEYESPTYALPEADVAAAGDEGSMTEPGGGLVAREPAGAGVTQAAATGGLGGATPLLLLGGLGLYALSQGGGGRGRRRRRR